MIAVKGRKEYLFNDWIYWLLRLFRPNLVKAETNFESQMILITRFINLNLPTFVDVNPEERLNMVKAETRLENEILVFHRGFQPLDIDYPKVEYNGNLQFSHRFGGI